MNKPGEKRDPKLGSEAFGHDEHGRPTGSQAFGSPEPKVPLKGALLVGNDPAGAPTGSEAFGGSEPQTPLKGALLIGNDPAGAPTGSEAFGGSEPKAPLKGALLVGNDPAGAPTGSEAFGAGDALLAFRGSQAFGAQQLVPEKLGKDEIGYDFGGVLLKADETSLAGIRKDARDHLRERVLHLLERRLGCEAERLRHGLGENAIPWGRLRRDRSLDRPLAEELRRSFRRAPGEVLGIAQVRDLLEGSGRMHTFALHCEWDSAMLRLRVYRGKEVVAEGRSALHKEQSFFVFKSPELAVLGYVDALAPQRRAQQARIRDAGGAVLAVFDLHAPKAGEPLDPAKNGRFKATIADAAEKPLFLLEEQRVAPMYFLATLSLADGGEIGRVEERITSGKIRTQIELDLQVPSSVAWGVAAITADLARLRRQGWPEAPAAEEGEAPEPESIEEALGPRRGPRRPVGGGQSD